MQNEDEVQAAFTRRSHYMLGNLSEEDLRRRMSQISQVYWHRRRQEEYLEVLEDTAVEIWANGTVVLRWHNTIQGQHIPIQLRAEWLRNLPDQACHVHFLPDGVGLSSVQNGVQTPIIAAENTAEQGIWARGGNRRRFGTVPYALDLERFWQLKRENKWKERSRYGSSRPPFGARCTRSAGFSITDKARGCAISFSAMGGPHLPRTRRHSQRYIQHESNKYYVIWLEN